MDLDVLINGLHGLELTGILFHSLTQLHIQALILFGCPSFFGWLWGVHLIAWLYLRIAFIELSLGLLGIFGQPC